MCMNETYTILNHGLSLIGDKQMLCILNNELRVHMVTTFVVQGIFFQTYIPIIIFGELIRLFNPWYFSIHAIVVKSLSWMFPEERYSSFVSLSVLEMISTLVYMLFAFICMQFGLPNTDYSVTSRVLIHWFIEASSPFVIFIYFIFEYCIGWFDDSFNQYQLYAIGGILLKISSFISMRYAECVSNSAVNDLKVTLFHMFCESH